MTTPELAYPGLMLATALSSIVCGLNFYFRGYVSAMMRSVRGQITEAMWLMIAMFDATWAVALAIAHFL